MPRIIWCARTLPSRCPTVEQGFSRGDLGFALSGISIAYGFSKFIMGSVSDRSNPRVFLPAGLILAAAVMLFMGFVPWATSSIAVMFVLLFLCGWFRGMGWPPCGRTMVHWWSQKERGGIVSVWNCAHNVGGGSRHCCSCWGWRGLTTGKRRSICQPLARLWWRCSLSQ